MQIEVEEGFCFLNRQEANSWNRVNNAPGARMPNRTDHDRVAWIIQHCDNLGITRMRSEDGVKLWKSES